MEKHLVLVWFGPVWFRPLRWAGQVRRLADTDRNLRIPLHAPLRRDHGYIRRVAAVAPKQIKIESWVRPGKAANW